MKLMRNIRTGKLVVYDESLLATGRFEEYVEPPSVDDDEYLFSDSLSITIRKASGESIERQA